MPNPYRSNSPASAAYDPRWFVWTIIFLLSTGVALVAFITLSDHGTNEVPELPRHITKNR